MDTPPRPRTNRRRRVNQLRRWVAIGSVSAFLAAAGLVSQPSASTTDEATVAVSSVSADATTATSSDTSTSTQQVAPMTTRQS